MVYLDYMSLKLRLIYNLIFSFACLSFYGTLSANDTITIKTHQSPFIISETFEVKGHQVLTAEPGVTIQFEKGGLLLLNGGLYLNGTETEPITLISNDDKWISIKAPYANGELFISHAVFNNVSILTKLRNVTLDHVQFTNSRKLEWNQSLLTAHGGKFSMDKRY